MEIIEVLILFLIATELAIIIYDKKGEGKEPEGTSNSRRELNGTFKDPLGDSYRKNTRGQYVPIRPHSRMLDGDEDDDV